MDGQGQRDLVGDFVGEVDSHGPDPDEKAINEALDESRSAMPILAVCDFSHWTAKMIDRHWERVEAQRRRRRGGGRHENVEKREQEERDCAEMEENDQRRRRRQAERGRE